MLTQSSFNSTLDTVLSTVERTARLPDPTSQVVFPAQSRPATLDESTLWAKHFEALNANKASSRATRTARRRSAIMGGPLTASSTPAASSTGKKRKLEEIFNSAEILLDEASLQTSDYGATLERLRKRYQTTLAGVRSAKSALDDYQPGEAQENTISNRASAQAGSLESSVAAEAAAVENTKALLQRRAAQMEEITAKTSQLQENLTRAAQAASGTMEVDAQIKAVTQELVDLQWSASVKEAKLEELDAVLAPMVTAVPTPPQDDVKDKQAMLDLVRARIEEKKALIKEREAAKAKVKARGDSAHPDLPALAAETSNLKSEIAAGEGSEDDINALCASLRSVMSSMVSTRAADGCVPAVVLDIIKTAGGQLLLDDLKAQLTERFAKDLSLDKSKVLGKVLQAVYTTVAASLVSIDRKGTENTAISLV